VAASAGHPLPLLARAGETEISEIGGQGPILGRFFSARYEQRLLPRLSGDRIVLFTDGLVEARRPDGEQFGDSRLCSFVAEGRTSAGSSSSYWS
jgi:sigma-B regulation protein RsbU (phosphoserine phosphatase)